MPSPLNGLMSPPASPTTRNVGPDFGPTEPAIGRRPPRGSPPLVPPARPPHPGAGAGSPTLVASDSPQYSGAVAAHSSMRCEVFTDFQSRNVESSPMPTFTVPSPTGKIHP